MHDIVFVTLHFFIDPSLFSCFFYFGCKCINLLIPVPFIKFIIEHNAFILLN